MRIVDQSKKYLVDRYCPHDGADLREAIIIEGKIVCPRHGWCFNLRENGKCDRANARLKVER